MTVFFKASSSCEFRHPQEVIDNDNLIALVEKQLNAVKSQITTLDNKWGLLEKQGETQEQTFLSTKELENQVEILKHENKEQQKQTAESKVNIEMAIEKINNMDEEYSDKIEELSNTIDMEWKASHAQLSDEFVGLEMQISLLIASVHKSH